MLERKVSGESDLKLHLRYIRLPNQVLELYDELIYRSERVIVGNGQIASANSVVFDGKVVLAMVFKYFTLICLESGSRLVR